MAAATTALVFNIFANNRTQAGLRAVGVGFLGLAGVVGVSIKKAADFDKTIRQAGAATGDAGVDLKEFQRIALDMGAKTTFSAQGAADAMLELAKGGATAAQISGGVLQSTLTLAAAGGLQLGNAAGYMTNALNMFGLQASDSASVAAALAGGANASTASVESLGMALGQVGPGAKTAGLSIQETVAALAAFDNAGIKGSDAGTSLKTMLTRLVPQTAKAKTAMKELGLDFTKADGSFLSLRNIAGQLQYQLKGLTAEERTSALATVFGSDATRAATVLMDEGYQGMVKYTKAASDKAAAENMAKVGTQGAAGAMEAFSGSIETAQISLALNLLPAVTVLIQKLTGAVNWMGQHKTITLSVIGVLGGLAAVILTVNVALRVYRATVIAVTVVQRAWLAITTAMRIAMLALNAAMLANPVGLVILALVALGVVLVLLWKKSETFRKIVTAAFNAIKTAAVATWNWIKSAAMSAFNFLKSAAAAFLGAYIAVWQKIGSAFGALVGTIRAKVGEIVAVVKSIPGKVGDLGNALYQKGVDLIMGMVRGIKSMAMAPVNAVKDIVGGIGDIGGAALGKLGFGSPSRLYRKYGRWLIEGMALGITDRKQVVDDAMSKMTDRLSAAVDKMKAARDKAAGLSGEIRSAFLGTANPTGLDMGAQTSFAAMRALMQSQLETATEFAAGITKLRASGLNATTLSQLTEAGPGSLSSVRALLQGGAGGIGDVNGVVSRIDRAGAGLGQRESLARFGVTENATGRAVIGSGKNKTVVEFKLSGDGDELVEAIVKKIRKRVRSSGGSVQVVLGGAA